jgi:hypothetical protein
MVKSGVILSLSKRLKHEARKAGKAGHDALAFDLKSASAALQEFASILQARPEQQAAALHCED